MREHLAQLAARAFVLVTLAGLACATAIAIHAQGGSSKAPPAQRQVTMREHEVSSADHGATPARKRDPQEVMAEVNEDLNQLKALSSGISTHAAATDQPLNYRSILENVTEIKKRSARLRTDLSLPEGEKDEKRDSFKDAEKGELQPALATLNKLLDSFLQNPIFRDAGAINMQLAAKARRDLDDIILLSDKLRKNTEKRTKTSGKTQ